MENAQQTDLCASAALWQDFSAEQHVLERFTLVYFFNFHFFYTLKLCGGKKDVTSVPRCVLIKLTLVLMSVESVRNKALAHMAPTGINTLLVFHCEITFLSQWVAEDKLRLLFFS